MRAIVNSKVHESVKALQLLVVTIYKWSINPTPIQTPSIVTHIRDIKYRSSKMYSPKPSSRVATYA
jgi:hypothetical protein